MDISSISLEPTFNRWMAGAEIRHMYTREDMARRLGRGNVAEAFFRFWYEENVGPKADNLVLQQFGYNPEGIVVGRKKVEMLKRLPRSPDYSLFKADELETPEERPMLGISVNGQGRYYTMWNAVSPPLCHKCARKAQEDCYEKRIGNLWYNQYNITNDYLLFTESFGAEVVLASIVAPWFDGVYKRIIAENLEEAALRYIRSGRANPDDQILRLVDLLTLEQRGRVHTRARNYSLQWLPYEDVRAGKVPQSVAGGPVSQGIRKVVCIDSQQAGNEKDLVDFLVSLGNQAS